VAGRCEHDNERSGSIKGKEFAHVGTAHTKSSKTG
jgi:hypothetical protein